MVETNLRPERHKRPGVLYAVTDDGLELPLIDVTNPEFRVSATEAEQRELTAKFLREQEGFGKLPGFLQRAVLWAVLRGSLLGDGLRASEGTFLTGIATYLLKLPPELLGEAYAKPVDRKIASGIPALSIRLRHKDMARLAVDALGDALAAEPERPLVFLNIAGGPAFDNLNTLLLLKKERPELLAKRWFRIHVLDGDVHGPHFGERALGAFSAPGAPLHGLDVRFEHQSFDWSEPSGLRDALERAQSENALCLGTSEGGLFEYGSDADIISALSEFRDSEAPVLGVIGSVTRDDDLMKVLKRTSKTATRPRGLPVFERLCRSVGYEITRAIERPMCDDVLVKPMG
ncbi:MAG: hypothetical protein QM756_04545 [Polyangiaceae bacterium]